MRVEQNLGNKKLGIIICADDFGISSQVNNAIIKLLELKKISAVSCLVTGKGWHDGANLLRSFRDEVDIGLHLSYCESSFNKALRLAYLGRLDREKIFSGFKTQLNCFFKELGRFPDFIDGHQHIHQLPIIRLALMDLISIMRVDKIYVRNSSISLNDIFSRKISILKNILIAIPGNSLKRYLSKMHIYTNNDFLGIYDYDVNNNPEEIFETFLKTAKHPNSILMIHPSCGNERDDNKNSCFDNKRKEEMRYFDSDKYKNILEEYGLYLTRFIY
ncbi:MAG: ChbG/HpnK family deacetylase [Candidatus Omnitrophota bacterium]|nr:ChbG/HpnK family deacetylase [Candidatus Omnitrophota bacterium]